MANAISETITRPVGPLPLWGWVGVGIGGLVVVRLVGRRTTTQPNVVIPFTPNTGGGGGISVTEPPPSSSAPVGGPVTTLPGTTPTSTIDALKLYAAEFIGTLTRQVGFTLSYSDKGQRVDRQIVYQAGQTVEACGGGPKPPPIMVVGSWVCQAVGTVGSTGLTQKSWVWDRTTGVDNSAELQRLGLPTSTDVFNNGTQFPFAASMSSQGIGSMQGLITPTG